MESPEIYDEYKQLRTSFQMIRAGEQGADEVVVALAQQLYQAARLASEQLADFCKSVLILLSTAPTDNPALVELRHRALGAIDFHVELVARTPAAMPVQVRDSAAQALASESNPVEQMNSNNNNETSIPSVSRSTDSSAEPKEGHREVIESATADSLDWDDGLG